MLAERWKGVNGASCPILLVLVVVVLGCVSDRWHSRISRRSAFPNDSEKAENEEDDDDEKDCEVTLFCQASDGFECLFDADGP
jgi:hypothetical protein